MSTLGLLDVAVLVIFVLAVLVVALVYGRGEATTNNYFLGGRRQPWILVGLSIVATEVSALTFIAVPAASYKGDWTYLQMYCGSLIGRILIAFLLLPAFYGHPITTIYEFLGRRFGRATQTTATLFFFTSRVIGSGFRLLAASIAISIAFEWPLFLVIGGISLAAVVYTLKGGIKAILWTNALQALVFMSAGFAAIVFLFWATPGNWQQNLQTASEAGKFQTFVWAGGLNNDRMFWVLFVYGMLSTMAALGTDQDMTQRMLTCPDVRRAQWSLMFNAVVGLIVVCTFLLIGTMLFVHYQQTSEIGSIDQKNYKEGIFAYFMVHTVPMGSGLRGFLLAGLMAAAMSSLDSALGALSSSAVTDIYKPFFRRIAPERHYLSAARWFVLIFGVLLAAVAMSFSRYDDLLWKVFELVGLIFGGMLGVFLLGALTRTRGNDRVNVLAMTSSVALLVGLRWYQLETEKTWIAWPWWIALGTLWTFLIGACTRRTLSTGTID